MNPEFSVNYDVTNNSNSNKLANIIMSSDMQPYNNEEAVKNYRKLLTRGSTITKDFLERVQNSRIVNRKKIICGYEFTNSHIWILLGLVILFCTSLLGTTIFWCTNIFRNIVNSHLILTNTSDSFHSFIKPEAGAYFRVHIFNYTNIEDYEAGRDTKMKLEDIGPFTYYEQMERIDNVFNDDGTLTFKEKRFFKYVPEKSKGNRFANVVVPNVPSISAVEMQKDANLLTRIALDGFLRSLNAKPFLTLKPESFIWGYDDNFFSVVKGVMSMVKQMPYEKFGILAHKNGTSDDKITINTGIKNVNDIGTIVKFNNDDKMSHWTDDCNRMDGTGGAFFGPDTVAKKEPLYIYNKDLCRKLPFYFQKEETILGNLKSYRYTIPDKVFAAPHNEPENHCYCNAQTGVCPPDGIFNATPCNMGPAYMSLPHFLHGDPILRDSFIGLKPDEEKHYTYLDVHPTMGFTMAGITRLQINVNVKRLFGINHLDKFHDDLFLPVAWFEVGLDAEELPQSLKDLMHRTQVTIPRIEIILKFGNLLLLISTIIGIVLLIKGRTARTTRKVLERNISALDQLIRANN